MNHWVFAMTGPPRGARKNLIKTRLPREARLRAKAMESVDRNDGMGPAQ
jgi:hypothetical protein